MSFNIVRNDITKVYADAIVNTANPKPVYAGGTDAAVYAAAGAEALLKERQKIGDIAVGHAAVTPAFALNAKYIIHTVGPEWTGGDNGEREAVKSCYESSLKLAKELGCESIAFPLIATGVYGFPKDEALKIAVSVFSEYLLQEDMEITLVVFDRESFVLSDKVFSDVDEYIDDNYVCEALEDEYEADRREKDAPSVRQDIMEAPKAAFMASEDSSKGRVNNLFGVLGRLGKKKESFPWSDEGAKTSSKNAGRYSYEADAAECEVEDVVLAEDKAPSALKEAERSTAPVADRIRESAARQKSPSEAYCGNAMPEAISGKPGKARSLDDLMANVSETWQESLFRLIDEKGYTDTEVYKRANVDRKLFSKIRSNADYQPKKITAVAFALALNLNLDETKDLIGRAGYALSPSSRFDLIIEYFIENGVYDTYTINLALFEHDQPLIGV